MDRAKPTLNDGGPAFPVAENHKVAADIPWTCGMTLRDYFAGQALVGCFNFWAQVQRMSTIGDPDQKAITQLAYEYADAMLAARATGGSN